MPALWTHPVFSVAAADVTWADVADFARRHGGWVDLAREAGEGLACEQAGHATTPEAVKEAATAFRYKRRLITAEETEAWLAARGLTVADWTAWIRRTVLRTHHAEPPVPLDDDELVWVTGRCSGALDDLALRLAERMAASLALADRPPTADDVDHALDRFRDRVVTDKAIEGEVGRRQLDWLRVELDLATFVSEGGAREALLCVNDDGLDLAYVCDLAGARLERRSAVIEDLPEPVGAVVLGARPGVLVGPVPAEGGFALARVESKVVPAVDDPDIRRRATELILAAALRREVADRVRWHDPR